DGFAGLGHKGALRQHLKLPGTSFEAYEAGAGRIEQEAVPVPLALPAEEKLDVVARREGADELKGGLEAYVRPVRMAADELGYVTVIASQAAGELRPCADDFGPKVCALGEVVGEEHLRLRVGGKS